MGLVLENVINSVCEKQMYCPGTVIKERQFVEVAPVYFEEHSRRAEKDVTEDRLVDDLKS